MKQYLTFVFAVLLIFSVSAHDDSVTTIIIEPHIGHNTISVTQTYTLTQEGLTQFEILTMSLSYVDLAVFDERGNLDYEIGENVIIGRNIYRKITVLFREPTKGEYTFTVTYWFLTYSTGKPVTGKYKYNVVNLTDSTVVKFDIPLTGITATSRSSPIPVVEEDEDSTVFSYESTEDAVITLAYELEGGIDYEVTKTKTISQQGVTFEVTYPEEAEIFCNDVEYFITDAFPLYLEETGIPLLFDHIAIELDKEENTWAAAEYTGDGNIRVLINNTSSYPFQFLAHELTHSYIGDFPRYLEEGMANYFEGKISQYFAPSRPENYIPNRELFFQTYERQFNEEVDITVSRYGLGLTDHQEALIYAKYSKGTNLIYEIAYVCGHNTVQEMLHILAKNRDCQLDQLVYELSEGEKVYDILKKYGFDVVPPHAYPAQVLVEEVSNQSWWGHVLCYFSGYKNKIREVAPDNVQELKADIENTGRIASQTVLIADGVLLVALVFAGVLAAKKVHHIQKENPKALYYSYFIPVAIAGILFSYFLYEFLFHGYKFQWILQNLLVPWGLGIAVGVVVLLLLIRFFSGEGSAKYIIDLAWSGSIFFVIIVSVYVLGFQGIILTLGYGVSLLVLFVKRRRE